MVEERAVRTQRGTAVSDKAAPKYRATITVVVEGDDPEHAAATFTSLLVREGQPAMRSQRVLSQPQVDGLGQWLDSLSTGPKLELPDRASGSTPS